MRTFVLLAGLTAVLVVAGCSQGRVEEDIQVSAANDPLNEPRSILHRYAEGQPLGSEVSNFPHMVENVRKVDSARADVLEKGLAEIQHAPAAERPALAKALEQKLQPSMK